MTSITDQIRVALGKRDGINEELMQPLALAYDSEVRRVNARLASACDLLRKGLRSEAVQSALAHPNALDAAAALDFPEIEDWLDILQFLGMPVPDRPRSELVDQLNEAIVEVQPLGELFKQHRRLALAKAPLPWRLSVLKRIAALDPANGYWAEDVLAYEVARVKQIQNEATLASSKKDFEQLTALHDELKSTSWSARPESKLVQQVEASFTTLRSERAYDELRHLGPKMYEAFGQFDEGQARNLYARWCSIVGFYQGSLEPSLREQVEPVEAWIRELDRESQERGERDGALVRLERALDSDASLEELERAYFQTRTYDEPPPDELLRRYELAVHRKKLVKTRMFQGMIAGIVAVTVVIAGAFTWWRIEEGKVRRATEAESRLASLIEANDLVGASTFYDDVVQSDMTTSQHPAVLALVGKLRSLEAEEKSRAEQFAFYLEQADAEDPQDIDPGAIARAERLAITESEKAAVYEVRSKFSKWESTVTREQTEKLTEELVAKRQLITQIGAGDATEESLETLGRLVAELQGLSKTYPRASSAIKQQLTQDNERATAMQSAMRKRIDDARLKRMAYDRLTKSSTIDEYAGNLDRFVRDFPAALEAGELSKALLEKDLWGDAATWNDHLLEAKAIYAGGFDATRCEAFRNAHSQFVNHPGMTPVVQRAIEAILAAQERKEIVDRVLVGLGEAVISDLETIYSVQEKNRYFVYQEYLLRNSKRLFSDANDETATRGVEVVVTGSGATKNQSVSGNLMQFPEPQDTIRWLTDRGNSKLGDFQRDWETEFLNLVIELAEKRNELDSLIKETLLQHLLAGAAEGSDSLQKELDNVLTFLRDRERNRLAWYEPIAFQPELSRDVKSEVIEPLKSMLTNREKVEDRLNALAGVQVRWVGFIDRSNTGAVDINFTEELAESGNLYTILKDDSTAGARKWVKLGDLVNGQVRNKQVLIDQISGRPVFFLPSE